MNTWCGPAFRTSGTRAARIGLAGTTGGGPGGGVGPDIDGGVVQFDAVGRVVGPPGAGLDGVPGDGDVGQGEAAVQVEKAAPVAAAVLAAARGVPALGGVEGEGAVGECD